MISKNYVAMCIAATELQERWEPKDGDKVFREYPEKDKEFAKKNWDMKEEECWSIHIVTNFDFLDKPEGRYKKFLKEDKNIWLPRQEDLIQIMEDNWEHGRCELIGRFHNFSWNYVHDRCKKYDFNELWLLCVMEYVFGKTWNGTTWEAIQ